MILDRVILTFLISVSAYSFAFISGIAKNFRFSTTVTSYYQAKRDLDERKLRNF